MDINQDIVNSTITIIDALKKNWKHKKGWRSNQIGIKKGSENYDLSLDNDYSQMRAAIDLRGETAKFLKDTGVSFVKHTEKQGGGYGNHNQKIHLNSTTIIS